MEEKQSSPTLREIGGVCRGHTCAIDEMCVQGPKQYLCVKHEMTTVKCRAGWSRVEESCYKLFLYKKTWAEAENICAINGAQLMTFESEEDYQSHRYWMDSRIGSYLYDDGHIWTGLQYSPVPPSWINVTFTDFTYSTSPPNLCMGWMHFLKDSRNTVGDFWETISCDESKIFVCEHRATDTWP